MNNDEAIGLIVFILLCAAAALAAYLLPTIIAFAKSHRNRWVILIINIFFGATFIGWLIALIWALNKIDDPKKGGSKYGMQTNDPSL